MWKSFVKQATLLSGFTKKGFLGLTIPSSGSMSAIRVTSSSPSILTFLMFDAFLLGVTPAFFCFGHATEAEMPLL